MLCFVFHDDVLITEERIFMVEGRYGFCWCTGSEPKVHITTALGQRAELEGISNKDIPLDTAKSHGVFSQEQNAFGLS